MRRDDYPELAGGVIGVLLFIASVTDSLPRGLRIGNYDRAGWMTAAVLLALVAVAWRKGSGVPLFLARMAVPVLAFLLAAAPLSNAWRDGRGGEFALGGLLPWSDASNYYAGAVEINEFEKLDFWNERRPVNAGINAIKLRVGGSVKGWLIASALLFAAGLVLAGREVVARFGPASAAGFIGAICAHGAYSYSASTMSENNGLMLGLLATAMLLAAIRLRDRRWFWAGSFALSLALDARAGAMFILPLLWAWGGLSFGERIGQRIRVALIAALLTLLALVPGRLYAATWAAGQGAKHANFSYTLYGIAAGNKGWRQVFKDYPQLQTMSDERERSEFIFDRAFERIRANPGGFVAAMFRGMWLFATRLELFVVQRSLLALLVVVLCFVRWRDPVSTLILAAFFGSVLSAPFLIWDGGSRVFSATLPLITLIQSMAIGVVEVRLRTSNVPANAGHAVPIIAAAIVAILVISPFVLLLGDPAPLPAPQGSIAFVPHRSGEWLNVHRDDQLARVWVPDVREGSVRGDLGLTHLHGIAGRAPFSIGMAVDDIWNTTTADPTWFITPAGVHLRRTDRPLLLVGEAKQSRRRYPYLLVRRVYVLEGKAWKPFQDFSGVR